MATLDDIRAAAALLRRGELVAFPTETVYGLGANALDETAVRKIYEVKGRPSTSPLIVHVASIDMARELAAGWPRLADALARRWWPGPLTIVVHRNPIIPDIVTAGLDTVGLRMPAHPLALELLRESGIPLAAPSANRFTELSPTTAEHVRRGLGDRVAMILDGGPCKVGIESTVVSVAGSRPALLRPGMISAKEIEEVIGPLDEVRPSEGAHPSPGLHERHYSPRTRLFLGATPREGRGVRIGWAHHPGAFVAMPRDAASYAAALYETLHRLDNEGWDWIAVEPVPETVEWAAVADRLRRAASKP